MVLIEVSLILFWFCLLKVPFEEVPELVAGRRVFIQKGKAYIAMNQVFIVFLWKLPNEYVNVYTNCCNIAYSCRWFR